MLDDAGVAAVVGRALAEHDLVGPLGDVPDVEVAERVAPDGARHLFVLNHGESRTVPAPVAGTDLLSGRELRVGDELELAPTAVLVIRCG